MRIIQSVPVPLLQIDARGQIVHWNAAARCLLTCHGASEQHLFRGRWLKTLKAHVAQSLLTESFTTDAPLWHLPLPPIAATNSSDFKMESIPFETYLCPVTAGPRHTGYLCLLLPQVAESASSRQLSLFFELSIDLFCIADLDGYFRLINSNFSRILGFSDAELRGQPYIAFVHPEDLAATECQMQQLRKGELVTGFRNRYRDDHGRYVWLEWTARASLPEGLVYASARNVTQQVEMEQQLQRQEQRERAILDNTSALIYVKDIQGRYQFVNREFSRLFHIPQDEVAGKTDFDLFPQRLAEQFHHNDRTVLERKQPLKIEEIAPHDNDVRSYLSVKFPLFDADGEAISVAGISTDISDRVWLRRTHEELRLAQQVQRRLFPLGKLQVPGYDIHGKVMAASHLCGDYFDFIQRSDGSLVCCVADVSGHGLAPALEMVETRAMLRMLLKESRSLSETVTTLNRLLHEDLAESSFVTMFLLELQLESQTFHYVGAGHDALFLHADGTLENLPSTGTILGLLPDVEFVMSRSRPLQEGDVLQICTDGIRETMSPERELFGTDRMAQTLRLLRNQAAHVILDELFALAHAFSRLPIPRDDMTGIVIKVDSSLPKGHRLF